MKNRNKKKHRSFKSHKSLKSLILPTLAIILGIILFLWFLLPAVVAGIMNLGNMTGMGLMLIWIFYVLFRKRMNRWIKQQFDRDNSNNRFTRLIILLAGAFIVITIILGIIATTNMIVSCNKTPSKEATVVVLGCRVYGERASLMLRERLDAATEYLKENPEAKCVVSGGQGPGENITEAECMYRYLINKGIDADRIYKEEESTSTEENLEFSMEVIKANNLNEEIAIICNEFHLYRAYRYAGQSGLLAGCIPARTAGWLFPTYYVRELYAIVFEWFVS